MAKYYSLRFVVSTTYFTQYVQYLNHVTKIVNIDPAALTLSGVQPFGSNRALARRKRMGSMGSPSIRVS
jgi:hypothetical protein